MRKYIQKLKKQKILWLKKFRSQKSMWRRIETGVGITAILIIVWQLLMPSSIPMEEVEKREKVVELLTFGEWHPDISREILATLESSGDVDIDADIAGTIDTVLVKIGDEVSKGQLLATFDVSNDATQVTYENSLRTLRTTKMSAENSVRSAEITLQTAERSLEQTRKNEEQKYLQAFEKLKTTARNSETTADSALDWARNILGAYVKDSSLYNENTAWGEIGRNDRILKQELRDKTEKIIYQFSEMSALPSQFREADYLFYAGQRLEYLNAIQEIVRELGNLIRRSTTSIDLTLDEREFYQGEAETHASTLDTNILSLETQLETAKTQGESQDLALLTSENAVENARASLELARATGESNIASAQNSVSSSRTSQVDLEIRAPFAGKITAREIEPFDQVSKGDYLFSLVSENEEVKVVTYVTSDELARIQSKGKVDIKLQNGTILPVENGNLSTKIDSQTQKIQVEFPLEEFPEGMLVGSFIKVLLPPQNGGVNLLPISSISFEPDGAEVLTIDTEDTAQRRKISYGRILGDGVEIIDGVEVGEFVVRYRTRVHAGEKINGERKMEDEE